MKKFQFRLQVVLDIKEKLLEQKLLELSKVQRGLQEAVDKQKTLESYQLEINQALLRVFQSGNDLDLVEVQRYKDFINKLIVDISNQKVVVQNITKLLALQYSKCTFLGNLKRTQELCFHKDTLTRFIVYYELMYGGIL